MKLGVLISIGHNIGHSLASGVGLMLGMRITDVFLEAGRTAQGFLLVDVLQGTVSGGAASSALLGAVRAYSREGLPDLCSRQGVRPGSITAMTLLYGTHQVYGPHFTLDLSDDRGRRHAGTYEALSGRRWRSEAR